MGKGGVGKTAMVVRYTSDMFDTDVSLESDRLSTALRFSFHQLFAVR